MVKHVGYKMIKHDTDLTTAVTLLEIKEEYGVDVEEKKCNTVSRM